MIRITAVLMAILLTVSACSTAGVDKKDEEAAKDRTWFHHHGRFEM